MMYSKIKTDEEMIDYLIDCTLATVEYYLWAKKIRQHEFERQCGIAQKAMDFLGKKYIYTSRAKEVIESGKTVLEYYTEKRTKNLECFRCS